ncbi:MAG: hypothetical protein JRF71_15790 [Deltaproteobacteria bacterium]|nr:hypothetical protein [Deltaproteobacteria bacterium]MBW2202261.1 hypothetical protein [Deltaproteobacteria bacterium]
MEQEKFRRLLSDVKKWIVQTLAEHDAQKQPVAAANFAKLERFYPAGLLQRVQRVIVDRCPVPPLANTGTPQLSDIENWDLKGIPWENTIFIRRDLAGWDAVHFHELLHIVQWEYLGTDDYLTAWAIGTITRGYRDNPLEEMAFRHQSRFETTDTPYDVIREVTAEIANWPYSNFDIRRIT